MPKKDIKDEKEDEKVDAGPGEQEDERPTTIDF